MDGMKCNLRRIMYEKNIKTIAEVIRLTGANRQALTRMYKNRELERGGSHYLHQGMPGTKMFLGGDLGVSGINESSAAVAQKIVLQPRCSFCLLSKFCVFVALVSSIFADNFRSIVHDDFSKRASLNHANI